MVYVFFHVGFPVSCETRYLYARACVCVCVRVFSAYILTRWSQVEELVAGREREERERRAEARRDASLRDMRLQVLLTFLEYRGRGETSRQAWQSVLDEQFEMRMPLTPYRTFPPQQVRCAIFPLLLAFGSRISTNSRTRDDHVGCQ